LIVINFKIFKYIKIIFKVLKQCIFNAQQKTTQKIQQKNQTRYDCVTCQTNVSLFNLIIQFTILIQFILSISSNYLILSFLI